MSDQGPELPRSVVLRHIVEHPQRITEATYGEGQVALDIEDDDGDRTIVTIQAPTPR
jgi:hypothetical protein